MWEQEKGKGNESEMGAKVNYLELLKQWGDALLRIQIRQMDDLKLDGGWDNSFGTRNNKWTYWGNRTSDGC